MVRSTDELDKVDLPHECLCLKWKQLEVWIEKESQDAKTLRFLADSVRQSHLTGSALTEAVAWQETGRLKGVWGQRYLSRENLPQVDAWVTESQQLLDAQAEEKAKSARRLRWLARGATALAVVAVFFGVWALRVKRDANKAENKASLGEKAASVTNLLPTKPEKALLLAIQTTGENKEKLKEEDLPQVQSSLLSALQGAKWSNLFHTAEGFGATENVLSFVLSSRDEKTIVSTHVLWKERKMVVRLWDDRGNLIGSLPKQEAFAPVAISPDGMTVITRSDNGAVQLWSRKGELIKNLPLHGSSPGLVMAIATSADGKTIVTGKKGVVEFWNLEGESLGPSVSIKDDFDFEVVKISRDQRRILLLSIKDLDGAWLLDRTGKLLSLGRSVVSCEFSPDGQKIVTGSNDGRVQLWNREGKLETSFKAHEGYVFAVAFISDGGIFSGGTDGSMRLWNIAGKSLGEPRWLRGKVSSVAISRNEIVSGTLDGYVAFWPLDNGSPLEKQVSHAGGGTLSSVTISPDGKTIVGGGNDGTVRIWNPAGKLIGETRTKKLAEVTSVAVSPDGQKIVTGSKDGTVQLWDREGKLRMEYSMKESAEVTSVAVSSDGTIVAGSEDGSVSLSNRKGKLIPEYSMKESAQVTSVAISSNGTIVSGDIKGSVKVLRPGDAEPRILRAPPADSLANLSFVKLATKSVAISPDGETIVAGIDDGTVWLWILANEDKGKTPRPKTLRGHDQAVTSVAFSLYGKLIVTGSANGAVRLWDLKGNSMGSPLGRDTGNKEDVTVAAFSAKSDAHDEIVTVSRDNGRVWLWPIAKRENWLHEACNRVRNHLVFVDFDNNLAQEIAAELGAGIVEGAGKTCVELGNWEAVEKAIFLVRQGTALALRAKDSDVDNAVAKFQEAQNLDRDINLDRKMDINEKDPRAFANRLAAPAKAHARVDNGRRLAQRGEIDKAIAAFQEAQKYDSKIDLDPETRDTTKNIPKAVAQQLAARAKADDGRRLAQRGEIDKAIAAFQEAQKYDSKIDLDPRTRNTAGNDPKAVAQQLAARAKADDGIRLAQRGEIDKAIAAFQEAQKYDSKIDLDPRTRNTTGNDPKAVAQQLAARAKADDGIRLAQRGEIDRAIAAFQEAQKYDSKIDLDPETRNTAGNDPKAVAQQLAARAKADDGIRLAQRGEIDRAIAAFQEAQKYDSKIDLDPETRDTTKNIPKAVAQQLAARAKAQAKVDDGRRLAQRGEIDKAIAAFQEAQKYDSKIDLDPETRDTTKNIPKAVAQQLAARAKADDGRRLAQRGEIDKAIAAFQEAQKYDSKIDLDPRTRNTAGNDPKAVAQQLAARAKADDGRRLAQRGEIDKAIAAFQEAQKYDSKIDLDSETRDTTKNIPKAVAQQLAARAKAQAKVDDGIRLAQQGEIDKALQAYAEARKLDPSLETDAKFWNVVGWNFGLSGHAAEALKASEKAVELATKGKDPSLAVIRDTRGLVRALTGDKQGAIKDFEAFISSDMPPALKASRQQWVVALRNGQNPFTPEVLAELRTE